MKVLLVGINSKFIHSNLAIRYLKTYTEDLGCEVKCREFSVNDRKEKILEEIINEKPDLVGFSSYIWNIEYVTALSKLIKLVNNKIELLYGGPEVSYEGEAFLNDHCGEYLVEGEGEDTFKELILYKLGRKEITEIKGLYYKVDSTVNYNGHRELMDMANIIFPYNSNDDLDNKIVYYEASRGCPFNCKYCLSSTVHGVRFLPLNRVLEELKFLIDKRVRLVKFVDRTFNCNKKFAMEIWRYVINAETDTTFHFEISADLLSPEEIELLSQAQKGRIQFEVGVQTTNNEVLRNINRYVSFKQIEEKVVELQKVKNIKQHLDLIAGLPGENFDSFKQSFNDLYSIGPDEIQLGFLKLLKGSLMRQEADKWGIVGSPYPPYEVLKTNDLCYDEILKLKRVEEMVDKYYNSQKFTNILKYMLKDFNEPFDFYFNLGMFFYEKGYLDRNISGPEYYKVFLEFSKEKVNKGDNLLQEIIKFDYLKHNKKKWMPDFLYRENDKSMDRMLRERLSERYSKVLASKLHFEKFKIDIIGFVKDDELIKEDRFVAFHEEDSEFILDVTEFC